MKISEGKEKIRETSDQFTEQLTEGERIQEDGEATDRILQGVELDDLDEDSKEIGHRVVNEYSDTYDKAIEAVGEQVEGTAQTAEGHIESLGENKEKVERNAERYAEAAGVSELGRSAAESGESKMESDSTAYGELINENEQAIETSREKAKSMKSTVSGLFGG